MGGDILFKCTGDTSENIYIALKHNWKGFFYSFYFVFDITLTFYDMVRYLV